MALTYTNEITINLPRQRVVELMDDPDNMKHWQPGFVSMELISGTQGQVGAKSRLNYDMGKRKIEMTETITKRDLPDAMDLTFETKGVYNEQRNEFIEVDANTTKWVSHSLFEFSGFLKVMGWLMPSAFKKQSFQYLELFKKFAESQEETASTSA